MSTRRDVVITGCGAVSALGLTADALWDGVVHGRSGIAPIRSFDSDVFPVSAGEVKEPVLGTETLPRALAFAFAAAEEAARQAKLTELAKSDRCGVFCGGTIDFQDMSDVVKAYRGEKPAPNTDGLMGWWRFRVDAMAALVARHIGIGERTRMAEVVENACATGSLVIGEALRKVRHGAVDVAVALGATSWTNLVGIAIYHRLGALSSQARPASPFDARRSGFVMGEGSGAVVLETLEHARARGVEPLAAVTGYGSTASAFRIMDMPREGGALRRSMELALEDATRTPADVDYISAHGTATQVNDAVETRAIKGLLGDRATQVPVSSLKSMIGHTAMAAGVLEAVACTYALRYGIVPPTLDLQTPDPDCDLDYVPNVARRHPMRVALSNSFGAGGSNCTLVLEALEHLFAREQGRD